MILSLANYAFFDATWGNAGQTAELQSQELAPRQEPMCIAFYYYMKGAGMGSLSLISLPTVSFYVHSIMKIQ